MEEVIHTKHRFPSAHPDQGLVLAHVAMASPDVPWVDSWRAQGSWTRSSGVVHGSTAREKNSIHMGERMGNSVGRRFAWDHYQADKQSSQGGVVAAAAAAGVVVVALVAESHTSSGQELRTQMMVSAAAGSVLCREATGRSSRRGDLAVAPVLDLEDPCYR